MQDVIVIPGLGDEVGVIKNATNGWKKHGLHPIIFRMGWRDQESFEVKLKRLCELADKLSENGSKISVVGCSAGGSAALNLFIERSTALRNVVNICGRLRDGDYGGFRSLKTRAKGSGSFKESVERFEIKEKSLTENQREKIMTIHSQFGDELVPASTTTVGGARNITVPILEHNLSIYMALSLFSKPLISFLKQ